MQIPPDEFRLPFFEEEGFVRKLCPSCGLHYWTQEPDSNNCGDAPCVNYTFIGNSPVNKSHTVDEMREKFLSFFEERGHKRIKPYPVVARWRDDLMITIASIIDFQPYVTEGLIPPPANPLVISQPCIRFEDIDLAGYTAGRHLTFFEMGGHHAFNYQGQPQVYWKDQTVRYHHELLTIDLGVPSNLVTYKEGLWSGGGNAGFDLEGCVGGLEISTLVFMMYRVVNGTLEPMPIQVVDTGYGIERWAWLSQGSPSAFHTIYGPVLNEILGWTGLNVDEQLLAETAKYSCLIASGQKEVEREKIAKLVDIDPNELRRQLAPVEAIYTILDHTKSLIFILSEGVVPSNVQEGYLARLLFRRAYRLLRRINIQKRLPDVLEAQIRFWGNDFPQLDLMRDEIIEMVTVEERKYLDTLKRGSSLVKRYLGRSRGEIPVEKLVEFYDSHGLTPEYVSEVASVNGIKIPIPDDFYSLVALRHMEEKEKQKDPIETSLASKVEDLNSTRTLYYENPYMKKFDAQVLTLIDQKYVVLDKTAFYAEGGGQISDIGYLKKDSEEFEVKNVMSIEGVALHETVEAVKLKKGDKVIGCIDWDRRLALMRSHTATHLLLGASRRVLGEHAWQAGAQKGIDRSRLDISHYKRLTREEVEKIEGLANQVVTEGRSISCHWLQRDEGEAKYGLRLYQGGTVPGKNIRIVEVEGGWDVEACGGTHLSNTSEAGLIKIVNTERVQDGVERLIFSVGPKAIEEIQKQERNLLRIAEVLGSPLEKVTESMLNTVETVKKLRQELEILQLAMAEHKAKSLLETATIIKGTKIIIYSDNVSVELLIEIGNMLAQIDNDFTAVMFAENEGKTVVKAGEDAISKGVHAGKLVSNIARFIGGGGGGQAHFGQGGGGDHQKFKKAKEKIIEILEKQLV